MRTIGWIFLCMSVAAADETVVDGDVAKAIDSAIQRSTGGGFWGAVLVAKDGKVILAKGYGNADYGTRPNTPSTLFEIASTSKQFTAAAVLKLVMEGRIKLTDSIAQHIKGVPEDKAGITVHHLLTHTSGLNSRAGLPYNSRVDRAGAIRRWLSAESDAEPGEEFAYSNIGYALLAALVEEVTGQSFEAYSHAKLFKPAGLKDTGFINEQQLDRTRVSARVAKGHQDRTAADWHWGWGYRGMGGVVSTVYDLWRWDRALRGDAILDKKTKAIYYQPLLQGYACGWLVGTTARGTRQVAHSGGVAGFACNYVRHLDDDNVIVVLSNGAHNPHTITKTITDALFPAPRVTVSIDVSGYELSRYRAVEFNDTARWRAKKSGGQVHLILEDPARKHAVVTIRMPKPAVRKLLGDLEQKILQKRGGRAGRDGTEAGAYLAPYTLRDGKLELNEGMELQVLPRYVGRGERGEKVVDERILLILADTPRRMWCMMAKLGLKDAKALRKTLMSPE